MQYRRMLSEVDKSIIVIGEPETRVCFAYTPGAIPMSGGSTMIHLRPGYTAKAGDWIDEEWGDNGEGFLGWTLVGDE